MALFSRRGRHPQDEGMSRFRAGLITLVLLALLSYFGFTKANPFASPYELSATFDTAGNLKPRSPVRIAGVEVGKVTKVEPVNGTGGARVEMEIQERGLPIHQDAQLKVRPRIFLEGNFFVDLEPGSPSAPVLDDGATIPTTQTAAPVQFSDLLAALQSDTREDLRTFLREYSKGLEGAGARGFNQSIRYWAPAYRSSALANDATLGVDKDRDLRRLLRGQQRTFAALVADEEALKGLVTNFSVTAGALAREDDALAASLPALRDTLRAAQPALRSLNDSLPSLRAFAREALPGVRSSGPALDASLPFLRQLRRLVSREELRGAARELRRRTPSFVALNETSVPLLRESRQLSACTNRVLVPFIGSEIPNPAGEPPANSNQKVREQIQREFPGLAGESRLSDGWGQQWFHAMGVPNPTNVHPAPPPVVNQPPPRRPDVPCETQEPPNLNAPGGPVTAFSSRPQRQTRFDTKALMRAARLMKRHQKRGQR
jgi:phospholipid/cholesterol/gamma-HCH transport system substrate-binding protein